jgi:hypothetical protein
MPRTCSGHGRTREDSYGFYKIKSRTKTDQDTDILKNEKKIKNIQKNEKNASKMSRWLTMTLLEH